MAGNATTSYAESLGNRHTSVAHGTATITSFVQTTAAHSATPASVHDCATPGQAGLSNCVWPMDYVNASGSKGGLATPVGIVCRNGITVQTTGTASIGWA